MTFTVSRLCHVATVALLVGAGLGLDVDVLYWLGVAVVAVLLAYEQSLVSAADLSQVKKAFDLNGYVGILYLVTTAAAIYAR